MFQKLGKVGMAFVSGAVLASFVAQSAYAADMSREEMIARGRYLVQLGGCNDCHTAGYMPQAGAVPEVEWLKGDAIGWRGPWGTTYAKNLRLFFADFDEDTWVEHARNMETRPPMPWFTVRIMKEEDLRAIYQFVRYLGPAGTPVPEAVGPEDEPLTVYFNFSPQEPVK